MGCIVYQTNKKTGVVYAYWNETHRDPVTKKPKSQRTYMGRVDPKTNTIIEKAENGKRNRSRIEPVQTDDNTHDANKESDSRVSQLEQQLLHANDTIAQLTSHVKRTEIVLKKIGDLVNNIPKFEFDSI